MLLRVELFAFWNKAQLVCLPTCYTGNIFKDICTLWKKIIHALLKDRNLSEFMTHDKISHFYVNFAF